MRTVIFLAALVCAVLCESAGSPSAARDLVRTLTRLDRLPPPPRPNFRLPTDPNMLFFLQRSSNANTIVYAARMGRDGKLDAKNPVEVFWRRYEEDGRRRDLNFIERTIAYGVDVHSVAGHPDQFVASLVSLPDFSFRIERDERGDPVALMPIGGRLARLVSVYLQVDESGLLPVVLFMDVYAVDRASGHVFREHLAPS